MLGGKARLSRRDQALMVGFDYGCQRGSAAMVETRLCGLMKSRDVVGELGHRGGTQSAGFGELVEQQRLIEAPHHDDPIDRRAGAREADLAIGAAGQSADLEIELGCRAPIESELALARHPAPLGGREIEIGVRQGSLELVGAVAGEKDQRGVGLDDIDLPDRRSVRARPAQKIDDVALIVGHS
jgi:hypothetical protein